MKFLSFCLLILATVTNFGLAEKVPWDNLAKNEKNDFDDGRAVAQVPNLNLVSVGDEKKPPPILNFPIFHEKTEVPTGVPFLNVGVQNQNKVDNQQSIDNSPSVQSKFDADQLKISKSETANHKRRQKTTKQPVEPVGFALQPPEHPSDQSNSPNEFQPQNTKVKNANFGQSEFNVFSNVPKIADLDPPGVHHNVETSEVIQKRPQQEIISLNNDGKNNRTDPNAGVQSARKQKEGAWDGAAFSKLVNNKFSEIVKNLSLTGYIKSEDSGNEKILKNISDSFTTFVEKALQEQQQPPKEGSAPPTEDQQQILNEGADKVIGDYRKKIAESYNSQKNSKNLEHIESNSSEDDEEEGENRQQAPQQSQHQQLQAKHQQQQLQLQAQHQQRQQEVQGGRGAGVRETPQILKMPFEQNGEKVMPFVSKQFQAAGRTGTDQLLEATRSLQANNGTQEEIHMGPPSISEISGGALDKMGARAPNNTKGDGRDHSKSQPSSEETVESGMTGSSAVPGIGVSPNHSHSDKSESHSQEELSVTTSAAKVRRPEISGFFNLRNNSREKSTENEQRLVKIPGINVTQFFVEATTKIYHEIGEFENSKSTDNEKSAEFTKVTPSDVTNGSQPGSSVDGEPLATEKHLHSWEMVPGRNFTQIFVEPTAKIYDGPTRGTTVMPEKNDNDDGTTERIETMDGAEQQNHTPEGIAARRMPATLKASSEGQESEPAPPAFQPRATEGEKSNSNDTSMGTRVPQFIFPTPLVDVLENLNRLKNATGLDEKNLSAQSVGGFVSNFFPTPLNWGSFAGSASTTEQPPGVSDSQENTDERGDSTKSTENPIRRIFVPPFLLPDDRNKTPDNPSNSDHPSEPTRPAFVLLPENETEETQEVDERITTGVFPIHSNASVTQNVAVNISTDGEEGTPINFTGLSSLDMLNKSTDGPSFNTTPFIMEFGSSTTLSPNSANASMLTNSTMEEEAESESTVKTSEISTPINESALAYNQTTTVPLGFSQPAVELFTNLTEKFTTTENYGNSTSTEPNENLATSTLGNFTGSEPEPSGVVQNLNFTSGIETTVSNGTGSVEITVPPILSTEKPSEFATWRLRLTNVEWDTELSDKNSWQYKKLNDKLYPDLNELFTDLLKDNYVNTTIQGFSAGSVVVSGRTDSKTKIDFAQFSDSLEKALKRRNFKLAEYSVDPSSINVDNPGGSAPQTGVKPQRGGVPGYVVGIIIAVVLVLAAFFGAAYCVRVNGSIQRISRRYRTRRLRDDHYMVDAETMNGGAGAAVKTWQRANNGAPASAPARNGGRVDRAAPPMTPSQATFDAYEMKANPTAAAIMDVGAARINHGYQTDANGRSTTNGSAAKKTFHDIDLHDSQQNEASSKH